MMSYAIAELGQTNTRALRSILGGVCQRHVRSHLSTQLWFGMVQLMFKGGARVIALDVPLPSSCAVMGCGQRSAYSVYVAPLVDKRHGGR